ncbi:polyprenyl synthetase family protein [Rickettsiales endosymbiont of Stachyamoeba lipophora]|uniref:polyprenyl synthetase family protein n=1 Tax=Rickettsiales endosymbiont of Stachyamoeba lipophora TaxID=2486578 RepID=UPI000F64549A|nr:polyprenyl synthetase family protein [Rickettsiales endosymbiont of Stachyamoeba lipophora]AZL14980.1 polyprenyl synthetase family protein [Rickettsiales endosymbiont of Stachyamoeba lipophora]
MLLEEIYKYYGPYLKKVDNIIYQCCKNRFPLIADIVQYVITSGGKRLRPLLTILAADMCGNLNETALKLAASVELIHTATLLHDDVIDHSELRRNKPTVNYNWGNKTSILMGDFLFSQAFELMVTSKSFQVLELLSSTSAIISEGEIIQLNSLGDIEIGLDTYYTVINAKTAALFAASTKIASLITESNEGLDEHLYQIGKNFGMSYQITDDFLDYTRSTNSGKNPGDDFYEGKVTLPIILLKTQADKEDSKLITAMWNNKNFDQENFNFINSLITKYDITNLINNITCNYLDKAYGHLKTFPDNTARKSFATLIDFCIKRDF